MESKSGGRSILTTAILWTARTWAVRGWAFLVFAAPGFLFLLYWARLRMQRVA
jgi:hypothetical protein